MPKAPSICGTIGCPEPVTTAGRCDQHQRQAWASNDPRRDHLPRNWPTLRKRVLARDHYRCTIRDPGCLLVADQVDHMGSRGDHRMELLRAVCSACHASRTAQQGVQAKATIAARNTRPPETHPGLTG